MASKSAQSYDFIVLGGGIVGLAAARELQQRYTDARVLLLEKESALALHQTGRNSGVIHAGVYYAPGSLKADFCRRGLLATKAFCQEQGIAVDPCGKLLVATDEIELERMANLWQRCQTNGIETYQISAAQLKQREPNIQGLGAIWVPSTAVVDYRQVCLRLAEQFQAQGGEIRFQWPVQGVTESSEAVRLRSNDTAVEGGFLLACAGLMADRVAAMMGAVPADGNGFQIVPFRGEYYRLPAALSGLINHLIYPIPDPDLPFLGVHLTRTVTGGITVGPNAVLGFKREGYGRFNFSCRDTGELLSFAGIWPLLKQHRTSGWQEFKDAWNKAGYLRRVQKYCPGLGKQDLLPEPVGIRAQAVLSNGQLVHDFLFAQTQRSLHVCNAPSPAATSAFPIATHLVDQVASMVS